MSTPTSSTTIPFWTQALRFIPTLVTLAVVGLLYTYKPAGYKTMLLGFALAYTVVVGIIMMWSVKKARARKSPNA